VQKTDGTGQLPEMSKLFNGNPTIGATLSAGLYFKGYFAHLVLRFRIDWASFRSKFLLAEGMPRYWKQLDWDHGNRCMTIYF
jgi:hypothetical protein